MLDIKFIRANPDAVRDGLAAKKADAKLVDEVLALDGRRREMTSASEALQARKNELSKIIPAKAKAGEDIAPLKAESKDVGERIAAMANDLKATEEQQEQLLLRMPNLPHSTVPRGHDESANAVVRTWGEKPAFAFAPKTHWDLGKALGILDLERATKISGSGYYVLRGDGARLERALISWMIHEHTSRNGYEEVAPPFIVTRKTMQGTGQLPKFEDDLYGLDGNQSFLVPTAEVPVTNLLTDEILDAKDLPVRMCAYSPCFRREAGSYGKEVRGITRVHQFSKVEMVQFADPANSYEVHESLTKNATDLLEALGLHYRVLCLCSGDLSFSAAKCYDLEVWAPGMDRWLEVSSCSNFEDYQARRANIRFRREQGAKPEFVHTLNGSGLALPRLLIALFETYQQPDGSIKLPPVVHEWFRGEKIG